jgi:hypothetical protein
MYENRMKEIAQIARRPISIDEYMRKIDRDTNPDEIDIRPKYVPEASD